MTAQEIVNCVDEQIPNTIAHQEKLRWVSQLEDILRALFPGDEEAGPQGAHPWEDVYLHYLEMKICYAQGQTARYNQANTLFHAAYDNYRSHRSRTGAGTQTQIRYF